MSIISAWTPGQWAVFLLISAVGLSAIALGARATRSVHGWGAPALRTVPIGRPRPSIVLAARRRRLDPHMGTLISAACETADPRALPALGHAEDYWPADEARHLQPGPGSITSIAEAEGVFGPRDEDVDADLVTLFGGWEESMRRHIDAALAPSMLTAIRWAIEGAMAGVDSAAALDVWHTWHTSAPTGEYPYVEQTGDLAPHWHPYATAC